MILTSSPNGEMRKPLRKLHVDEDDDGRISAPLPGLKKDKKKKPASSPSSTGSSLVQLRLKRYDQTDTARASVILNEVAWFISDLDGGHESSDGHVLATLLSPKDLDKVADYFDGGMIRTQKKKERRDSKMLSIVLYLYEVQHKSWDEIREILRDNVSFKNYNLISLGKRISKIREAIKQKKQMWEKVQKLELPPVLSAIYDKEI